MMTRHADSTIIEWVPISPRIITARFQAKGRNLTIVQCNAPTNNTDIEKKEQFYETLQAVIDTIPKRDIRIVMGDMNAKIDSGNSDKEEVMGKHGKGDRNENGDIFTDMCASNDLVIRGSTFPHKEKHKATWVSPDGKLNTRLTTSQ